MAKEKEPERSEEDDGPSEVDAMGKSKRREVIGKQYGATLRKRLFVYGAVVGFVVVAAIVFFTVVTNYDNRDRALKDTAPWTEAGATDENPRDVDFKANGPRPKNCPDPCEGDVTIKKQEIINR